MIKIYSMPTCPDCAFVEEQIKGDPRFEIINIGLHVRNLKQFLDIRDKDPLFEHSKKIGDVGIPCFVLEDGSVTISPEDVGLKSREDGVSCSIDGHKGC